MSVRMTIPDRICERAELCSVIPPPETHYFPPLPALSVCIILARRKQREGRATADGEWRMIRSWEASMTLLMLSTPSGLTSPSFHRLPAVPRVWSLTEPSALRPSFWILLLKLPGHTDDSELNERYKKHEVYKQAWLEKWRTVSLFCKRSSNKSLDADRVLGTLVVSCKGTKCEHALHTDNIMSLKLVLDSWTLWVRLLPTT